MFKSFFSALAVACLLFVGASASAQCAAGETEITITMNDSFGDGWQGAGYTITDFAGNVLFTGDIDSAQSTGTGGTGGGINLGTDVLCLPADGCYTVDWSADTYPGEVSWTITGGNEALSGGASETVTLNAGTIISGCTDALACNYDATANCDSGMCAGEGDACDDGDAGTTNDVYDAVCGCAGVPVVNGCTDPTACNYDATANVDDGSCDLVSCVGCADPAACNYGGAGITQDDGSCFSVGDICDDGDAATVNDTVQGDCSCAGEAIVFGCTDENACNYDPAANTLDGSCANPTDTCDDGDAATVNDVYQADCSCAGEAIVLGCTNPDATNFDPLANTDDGSCIIEGCTDDTACNYNMDANSDDGSCFFEGDACDDGLETTFMDSYVDCVCVGVVIVNGCTDDTACNYNENANNDDGTCCFDNCLVINMFDSFGDGWAGAAITITQEPFGDLVGTFDIESAAEQTTGGTGGGVNGGVDVACVTDGCFNYSVSPDSFDSEVSWNITYNGNVVASGSSPTSGSFQINTLVEDCPVGGCTNPMACNYDMAATVDDGSCCLENCVRLTVGGGSFASEHSWNLYDSNGTLILSGTDPFDEVLCLPSDCGYQMELIDSLNDSWDGASYQFSDANDPTVVYGGGTLASGASPEIQIVGIGTLGCTDPLAENYDENAECDNGTCSYCTAGQATVIMNMTDTDADGWEGTNYSILDAATGALVAFGSLDFAAGGDGLTNGIDIFCLEPGCYSLEISGGSTFSIDEIGWSLELDDGTVIFSGAGQAFGPAGFPIGGATCDISGCTDPFCFNYNQYATTDDGSCVCPPSNDTCDIAEAVVCGGVYTGNTELASTDIADITCDENLPGPTVWYQFDGDGSQVTVDLSGSSFDTKVAVFSGACDNLVCVGGNDDGGTGTTSSFTWVAEAGVDYFIVVGGFGTTSAGDYTMAVTCADCSAVNITNDDCVDAQLQICGALFTGTTCCNNSDPEDANVSAFQTGYGQWFVLNSADYDTFEFDLQNTGGSQINISIYEAGATGCDDLTLIAIAGPVTGSVGGDISDITTLTENTDYYFWVFTEDPTGCGDFTFETICHYIGCTDSLACNYDAQATLNEGCLYDVPATVVASEASATNTAVTFTIDADGDVDIIMGDTAGDGWNGATYTITETAGGTVVATGDLNTAATGDGLTVGGDVVNLIAGEYTMTVGGGSADAEASWSIALMDACTSAAPTNDECANAEALPCETSATGSTGASTANAPNTNITLASGAGAAVTESFTVDAGMNPSLPVTIVTADSFGDGWGGGQIVITGDADGITYLSEAPTGAGNTYSAQLPSGDYTVTVTTDTFPSEISWSISAGCNAAGAGVWYSFTGTGDIHTISTCGSLIDTQVDVFVSDDNTCDGNFSCYIDPLTNSWVSEVDDNSSAGGCGFFDAQNVYLEFLSVVGQEYFIYVSSNGEDGEFTINHTCTTYLPGCTNDGACNYDMTATYDDGSCDFASCVCADAGCPGTGLSFEFAMTDDFGGGGDGWNGATYTITNATTGVVVQTGSIDNPTDGGTDVDNFEGNELGNDYFCLCDLGCYNLTVGGGDFDAEIGWTLSTGDGVTVIDSGGAGDFTFSIGGAVCGCNDPTACNFDAAATVFDNSCEYETCAGCMDDSACNYDPEATFDDGTYCCFDTCLGLILTDSDFDGWEGTIWSVYQTDGTLIESGTVETGGLLETTVCLLDGGCYYFSVTGGTDINDVGWALIGADAVEGNANGTGGVDLFYFAVGNGVCTTCQEPVACNYDPTGFFADCTLCEFSSCTGCTYATASNYDPSATIDDGTCEVSGEDPCPEDLDGDGTIGTGDLLQFLGAFGTPC